MPIAKYIYLNPKRQKANIVDINESTRQTLALLLYSAGLGTFMPDLRPHPSWSQDFPGNVKFCLQEDWRSADV